MSNLPQQVMKCQRRKKLDVVERFGGKCQKCGYDKCINALEFHHIGDKKESPSYIIMRWSWERAKEELSKCIMLCANCHREAHYEDRDTSFELPAPQPWLVIKCQDCGEDFDTRNSLQRYCSQTCYKLSSRRCERPTKEELRYLVREHRVADLAKRYGVTGNTIRKWCKGYEIDWLEAKSCRLNPLRLAAKEAKPKGMQSVRKLTLEQARAALLLMRDGKESLRLIAKRFGICHTNLLDIRRGRSYRELAEEFPDLIDPTMGRNRPVASRTLRNTSLNTADDSAISSLS